MVSSYPNRGFSLSPCFAMTGQDTGCPPEDQNKPLPTQTVSTAHSPPEEREPPRVEGMKALCPKLRSTRKERNGPSPYSSKNDPVRTESVCFWLSPSL